MKHRIRCTALLFSILFLLLSTAQYSVAHSLFIQSGRYMVEEGKDSPLFFSYGHIVPFGDGLRAKKVASIRVFPPQGEVISVPIRNEKGLQSHMVDYSQAGTWMLTAQTTPGYYTVYTDKKGREHHVIKPISAIKKRAAEITTSYLSKQYAKTYVVCDKPGEARLPVAGLALELMPSQNLFTVKPGGSIDFQVYQNGKPFTGEGSWDATYAGFSTLSEDMFYPESKVKDGRFSLLVAHPGRWYVRYFVKIDAPEAELENYRQMKLSASFVFQVDNVRRRERVKKK